MLSLKRIALPVRRSSRCYIAESLHHRGGLNILLSSYGSPHRGRRGHQTSDHVLNTVEELVLAHKKPAEEKKPGANANKRVVASDVPGMSTGQIPSFTQNVDHLQYPPGAPNGGPRVLFPARVLELLVGR